ncbi:uncharacterized protein CLUP02_02300 [Colletotrichum lupini]|uniref:Uncharacterized protein n=1 Tax=Colletotrichum lupini TaxID=145971 RepID=A0A9Q8SE85_9PEZI|nr:uncharacterized protein CLUP02_02300 [Colletotrichum lupini]UQC75644.1 hypothetical protein CLUP02_02300 [Colletotrichum lupini]
MLGFAIVSFEPSSAGQNLRVHDVDAACLPDNALEGLTRPASMMILLTLHMALVPASRPSYDIPTKKQGSISLLALAPQHNPFRFSQSELGGKTILIIGILPVPNGTTEQRVQSRDFAYGTAS